MQLALDNLAIFLERQKEKWEREVSDLCKTATYRDPRILAEEENNIYVLIRSVVNLKKNKLISNNEMYEILNRIQERCKARAIFFSLPFEVENDND
jgi:uncharacterized protein YdcH (DUF465 family)